MAPRKIKCKAKWLRKTVNSKLKKGWQNSGKQTGGEITIDGRVHKVNTNFNMV